MNVSIGKRWEEFVEGIVQDGRYGSASEVVREGLRLVEEREAKLAALRQTIEMRSRRRLERRPTAQFFLWLISHSTGMHNHIFHKIHTSLRLSTDEPRPRASP